MTTAPELVWRLAGHPTSVVSDTINGLGIDGVIAIAHARLGMA